MNYLKSNFWKKNELNKCEKKNITVSYEAINAEGAKFPTDSATTRSQCMENVCIRCVY